MSCSSARLCRAALGLFALIFLAVLVCDRRVAYALSGINVPLSPNVVLLMAALVILAGGASLWTHVRRRPVVLLGIPWGCSAWWVETLTSNLEGLPCSRRFSRASSC